MFQNQATARTDQTADKILRVLFELSEGSRAQTARQLSERLAYPISSVYRYLAVLKAWELVMEDPLSDGFLVGPRALTLAYAFEEQFELTRLCRGVMQRLMEQTQETVLLLIPAAYQVVCLESVESHQPLRYSFQRGVVMTRPLRGASVQAMLPYYSQEYIQDALNRDPGIDPKVIFEKRELIRQQGYAISQGEVDDGVLAVAAAILGPHERLLGSLSLVAPAFRVSQARRETYIRAIRQSVQDIAGLIRDGKGLHS